jgi:nucleotide-binding universal stress UspA family protein
MKKSANTLENVKANLSVTLPHQPRIPALARNGHARRLTKILVPVDFSEESKKAIAYALSLAKEFGGTITLLHVVEPIVLPADYGYGPVLRQIPDKDGIRKAKARLKALRQRMIGSPALAETIVLSGLPFFEITEAARALETDMIVMGAHSSAGQDRGTIGSTADKVVHHAPCSVLVVHRKEHEFAL